MKFEAKTIDIVMDSSDWSIRLNGASFPIGNEESAKTLFKALNDLRDEARGYKREMEVVCDEVERSITRLAHAAGIYR